MRRFSLALTAAAAMTAVSAEADILSFTDVIDLTAISEGTDASASGSFALPMFDALTGDLDSVRLWIDGEAALSFSGSGDGSSRGARVLVEYTVSGGFDGISTVSIDEVFGLSDSCTAPIGVFCTLSAGPLTVPLNRSVSFDGNLDRFIGTGSLDGSFDITTSLLGALNTRALTGANNTIIEVGVEYSFSPAIAPIPLPAAPPMLLGGIGLLGLMRAAKNPADDARGPAA